MFEKTVTVPEGIEVSYEKNLLAVRGKKGELKRIFTHSKAKIEVQDGSVKVSSEEERRRTKAIVGTWAALIKNMVNGVDRGYEIKLKVIYSHFPVKFTNEGKLFYIHNFLGEKSPRKAKVAPGTAVKVDKDEIIVTGIDREKVGITAANIEIATKITKFDRRVFQDGCYISHKGLAGEQ